MRLRSILNASVTDKGFGFQEVPWEPFVPLTKEERVEVERAFSANRYALKILAI